MQTSKFLRALGAVGLCLCAFAATGAAIAQDAGEKKTITLVLPEEPTSLAAWSSASVPSAPILRNIEEALLNRDPVTNELVGELATSWSQVEPTRWRFILRDGVKFHDGSPFNAEAAAASLSRTWDPANVTMITSYLDQKMTFTAVDEHTLDVTTEKPDPLVPVRLYIAPISSLAAYKANPENDDAVPVGTGPYKFSEWNRGQQVVLEKNPDWWGNNAPDARGKPVYDEAVFAFRAESTVRTDMVVNGEADFARWISADDCIRAPACEDIESVETLFLRPDIANPVLGDKRVREAIALSFDKQQLLDVVLGGGRASAQIVGRAAAGYNADLKPAPLDIEKAKSLLDEARKDGVAVDGTTISIVAQPGLTAATDQVVEVIAAGMRSIGLTVDTKIEDHAIYIEQMRTKPVPTDRAFMFIARHGNEFMDYSVSLDAYYSCNGPTSGVCDPKLQDMLDQQKAASGDERIKDLQDIAAYVDADFDTPVIGQLNVHFATTPGLAWKPRLDGLILLKEMSPS